MPVAVRLGTLPTHIACRQHWRSKTGNPRSFLLGVSGPLILMLFLPCPGSRSASTRALSEGSASSSYTSFTVGLMAGSQGRAVRKSGRQGIGKVAGRVDGHRRTHARTGADADGCGRTHSRLHARTRARSQHPCTHTPVHPRRGAAKSARPHAHPHAHARVARPHAQARSP